jgi:hypothetical protein
VRYALILSLLLAAPCWSQTTATGRAETAGACSPAVTGNKNTFIINCGIDKKQGQKMLQILNKILANQLNPDAVMTKLDEILKAVNPNIPQKTFFCNGTWRTAGPGANAGLELNMGGDDSAFQEMRRLNNSNQYPELLKVCLAEIHSEPGWLTPRLFCGLAYLGTGDKLKAKEMLAEFDARTGPAYSVDACQQMSGHLHQILQ